MELLSQYQKRELHKYERILEAAALNPDRILGFIEDDPAAIVPVLKSMTDQVVRSEVIFSYTIIDLFLDEALFRHFFGTGSKLKKDRSTMRYKTFRLMLEKLYVLQMLSIVQSFKKVPKGISRKIAAINDLRNGLAHTFFLGNLSLPKKSYRGHNVFTYKGFSLFKKDAWEIQCFFDPSLTKCFPESDVSELQ